MRKIERVGEEEGEFACYAKRLIDQGPDTGRQQNKVQTGQRDRQRRLEDAFNRGIGDIIKEGIDKMIYHSKDKERCHGPKSTLGRCVEQQSSWQQSDNGKGAYIFEHGFF